MKVSLSTELLKNYPATNIGVIKAKVIVQASCDYTDHLMSKLKDDLGRTGLNPCNYTIHPDIALWLRIYQVDFGINPKTYRSSVDVLVRRALTKNTLWKISNIVDLYNCCSVKHLFPMGAYDLAKITGDIQIRYGKENETFQGIGQTRLQPVLPNHIVYADNEKILCWLWNHKDSQLSCIDRQTKEAIFFVDSIGNPKHSSVENACQELLQHLTDMGCQVDKLAMLNQLNPKISL